MENLLALLDKVQQISPLPVLSQEVIIVHNAGMQHWLNLSLAQQRGISMNLRYALPSQYLWQLVRSLASGDEVPSQSPYSREVLAWRLDALLNTEQVQKDEDFASVTNYWQEKNAERSALKRFQLASQLADLYEQYLIFRPQWLDDWQQQINNKVNVDSAAVRTVAKWQAKLWQLLIAQKPYNPKTLILSAIANIAEHKKLLPPRLTFFGINSLAPIWLEFISALSEEIEVHFFHLNPCYAYWGDILTQKQAIKSMTTWLDKALLTEEQLTQQPISEHEQTLAELIGNPLLANFGQQGREFLALLQQHSTINIDVFEHSALGLDSKSENISVLQYLQNDILTLNDARHNKQAQLDDSIIITSCHSALREVQALHDWLLHQFNQDKALTPKDVLVMCPQVENYAPYIDAVFSRRGQNTTHNKTNLVQLPCSIADRVTKDSEPLVAAFIELLQLPDSRFQVSKIIALLRLPAMQVKFSLTVEEIDKISYWLEQTSIHWGVNQAHKNTVLNIAQSNERFTWHEGLSRLLLGFAYGDEDVIFNEQLLLATIEGNDALLLGKLIQILTQLQNFAQQMSSAKTAPSWLSFLTDLLEQLFDLASDPAFEIIDQALSSLVQYCQEAEHQTLISLTVVREFLQTHFSQPDPGRQFLVGQVTFCSMLPMRSIPFKVIAVLGLNDGEFPRQRQPLGFDLMAMTAAKIGDRSRRGDDRYLFLEAIICARKALYLSYQGRNIRNNNELQPSLVLKELMEYLDLGYGWSLLTAANEDPSSAKIQQLPMQAFSLRNYAQSKTDGNSESNIQHPTLVSFNHNWLNLAITKANKSSTELILPIDEPLLARSDISISQLVSFFDHPSKYFAKNQLNLHFEHYQAELSDTEPFNNNALSTYQLKQQLLLAKLADEFTVDSQAEAQLLTKAALSGKFPDTPLTAQDFAKWQHDSTKLADEIKASSAQQPELFNYVLVVDILGHKITLSAQLAIQNGQCVAFKSSSAKAKDLLALYLQRLFSLVYQQQHNEQSTNQQASNQQEKSQQTAINSVKRAVGWYFDTKKQQVIEHSFTNITEPLVQLSRFIEWFIKGQQQALLINASIGERYFNARNFQQTEFEKLWSDVNAFNPLGADDYMHFFWPNCPLLSDHQEDIEQLYAELYQTLVTKKTAKKDSNKTNKKAEEV
jgi:exodeoxyribonuclease V gamma subunit